MISDKQTTSNCSVNLTIKPTTNENYCRLKRFSNVSKIWIGLSDELKTISWWLSSLSFMASAAKEKNKVEPDISYNGKNESGGESCSCSFKDFKRLFSRVQFTIEQN